MTGHILRTWRNHDGVTMAVIKTSDRREVVSSVPVFSKEGDQVRLVDGVWRLQRAEAA